jgi:mannan endo-1,4-beta-mannosidase
MINDYPALFGFDLANLEQGMDKNNSNISFEAIRNKIQYIYSKGGIITLMWAVNNPVNPTERAKDKGSDQTIENLFSNQDSSLVRYNVWLDHLAQFFKSLKASDNSTLIPILFRPFHECNGSWFWWGKNRATPQEYIQLYQYTVNYLMKKNVHNLLYVYSPNKFKSTDKYLSWYPGDNYVDVLGLDAYDDLKNYPANNLKTNLHSMAVVLTKLAQQKEKICALTETGFKNMPVADWWTNTLYSAINGTGLSYVMVWGNYGKVRNAYWGTFQGQLSAGNFIDFSKKSNILFLSKLNEKLVYGD